MSLHRNYRRILIACSLACTVLVGCEVSEPNRIPVPTATTTAVEPARPTVAPASAGEIQATVEPGQPGYPPPLSGYPTP
jgi:hypothetical protein